MNFVEDRVLDKIPKLKNYKQSKIKNLNSKFRKKFSKQIPTEGEIKLRYAMRIPVTVEKMENKNSSIHSLEKPWPGIKKIKEICKEFKKDSDKTRLEMVDIKRDLLDFSKKHTEELDNIRSFFHEELRHFYGILRIDTLDHQNNKIKIHKQAQVLKRDENEIIRDVKKQYRRIYKLEDDLFKDQVFNLQNFDPDYDGIEGENLRPEHRKLPDYREIAKLETGYDPENDDGDLDEDERSY